MAVPSHRPNMRLLITTQKVDQHDPVLGFFHRWLVEFAKHYEEVVCICLAEGAHSLPGNVRVLSLGKERQAGRMARLYRLIRYVLKEKENYDQVLVHMNPEYMVLFGWYWRLFQKPTALWYTHRHVNLQLRIAALFANVIFSSTPYSFRLKSTKARFIGHGIDTAGFSNDGARRETTPLIVSVGRITPIKHCEILIETAALLTKRLSGAFHIVFIGAPAKDADISYATEMRELVQARGLSGTVSFIGAVPYDTMKDWYSRAWISTNMVPAGGLDKAVIEAMAGGCIPLTSNKAFAGFFGPYADALTFPESDAEALAARIIAVIRNDELDRIRSYMIETAQKQFSVERIVRMIADGMQGR